MIVEFRLLISDVSLKMSARAEQAHFNNQKSTLINRQSNQTSVAVQKLDSFATSFGFQGL